MVPSATFGYADVPSQAGRVVLVTGCNQGLGLALVRDFFDSSKLALEQQPAQVIMANRSRERTETAVTQDVILNAEYGSRLKFLELDLADLSSVRRAACEYLPQLCSQLDCLVLNAGIFPQTRQETGDGHELTIQVCHLAHFLFTKLCWPLLLKSDKSPRVVPVSSVGHTWTAKGLQMDDLDWKQRKYDQFEAYFQAKLANVYFTRELARRCSGKNAVTAITLSPGYGDSGLYRDVSCMVRLLTPLMVQSCDKLSINTMRAATDTSLESGCYLSPKRYNFYGPPVVTQVSTLAQNNDLAEELWRRTEELLGEEFEV